VVISVISPFECAGFREEWCAKSARHFGLQSTKKARMAVLGFLRSEPLFTGSPYSVPSRRLANFYCSRLRDRKEAAHLYTSTDIIFGAGSSNELFSWRNGLILHKIIEAALDKGVIAIVPLLRPNTRLREKSYRGRGAYCERS